MARSRQVVDALLTAADEHAAQRNDANAVALLRCAATLLRRRHTGAFTSPRLEAQLTTLSASMAPARAPSSAPPVHTQSRRRVMHVVTRAHAAGGHSRLVTRWIESDGSASSSVVLTQPGDGLAPAELVAAVERSGGVVHRLAGGAIERALELRSLAHGSDMLVLSIHENDVTPSLAFAGVADRPPIVTINHAEHVFWVGASLADVVVNLRPASADLAIQRRGVPASRCVDAPLPVARRSRRSTTSEARNAMGIAQGSKVLLTVGWRYKFTPFAGDDIMASLGPILEEPDVHLVAVGPRDDDPLWSAARERYGGRVHAVGRQDDIQLFLDGADVFIDTYPIASLTAMLEAAMLGLPVVGLVPRSAGWPRVLREDDPALAEEIFDDVDAYRRRIRALLRDPAEWTASSSSVQSRVDRMHGADAWTSAIGAVEAALERAPRAPQRMPEAPKLGTPGTEDAILATYIADCEDRLIRPELRVTPDVEHAGGAELGAVSAGLARIDELLLAPLSPSTRDYEEALRVAESAIRGGRLRRKVLATPAGRLLAGARAARTRRGL